MRLFCPYIPHQNIHQINGSIPIPLAGILQLLRQHGFRQCIACQFIRRNSQLVCQLKKHMQAGFPIPAFQCASMVQANAQKLGKCSLCQIMLPPILMNPVSGIFQIQQRHHSLPNICSLIVVGYRHIISVLHQDIKYAEYIFYILQNHIL